MRIPAADHEAVARHINPSIAQLIVLALAEHPPPVAPHSHGDMTVRCRWCDATTRYGRGAVGAHSWHASDCLWRMAVEAAEFAWADHERAEP